MRRAFARFLVVLSGAVALALVLLVVMTLRQPPPTPSAFPNPNGYDAFVKAAWLLPSAISDFRALPLPELRALLATNSISLNLVRTGLACQCRVPVVFAADLPHGTNLAVLKRLGFALAAEGHVAELDRDPVTAAGDYLAAVRLGQEQSRGGLIIDSLVGIAVESIGLTPLEKLAPGLDAKECRKLATELERSEARRESARTFIANDDRWARRALGWRYYYYRLISLRTHAATVRSYSARYAAIEIRTRLLVLTLAARAYELERGHRPANPAELVPQYLQAVPLDPLTGTNLVSIP